MTGAKFRSASSVTPTRSMAAMAMSTCACLGGAKGERVRVVPMSTVSSTV